MKGDVKRKSEKFEHVPPTAEAVKMLKDPENYRLPMPDEPEPDFSSYDAAVTLAVAELDRIRDELKKWRENAKKTWRSEGEKDKAALMVVTLERQLIGAQRAEKLARAARARALEEE